MDRRRWKKIRIMAAALLMALMYMEGYRTAEAQDFTRPVSLCVVPAGSEYREDLRTSDILYDLYRVADVKKVPGYDVCDFSVRAPYSTASDPVTIGKEITSAGWRREAAKALVIALNADIPVIKGWSAAGEGGTAPASGMTVTDDGTPLSAGLYLLTARGASAELHDATAYADLSDPENPRTRVYTEEWVYTYEPVLIALPYTSPVMDERPANTADGEWFYDVTAYLKPERVSRFGSIRVSKKLLHYGSPAEFTFTVKAVYHGETVLTKNVVLPFDKDCGETQELLVEGIPAGAEVTVEEKTPPGRYFLVSGAEEAQTVLADKTVVFCFVNDYEEEIPTPPPTGDRTDLMLYMILAGVSGIAVCTAGVSLLWKRKRKKD